MKKIAIISIIILSSCSIAFAAQNFSYETVPVQNTRTKTNLPVTLKRSIVTVPAGETFRAIFMAPITSETAYTGQQVLLALGKDFFYEGKLVAPAGTSITGAVIGVSKAKHGALNGKLTIRCTQMITPTGLDIPISAIIKTDDNSGTLIGGNSVFEEAMSEPGNPKFPNINMIAGSGGGLIKSVWDKGKDVEIPVNAVIELVLTQPITVNPENK